ncbi:nucleotide sugar dehydrogenase [Candidatus Pelagibacter sp. HIMB1509]|uniref:nucleotide sugar dehydrogenase n=1 Tax=Candidatus Pelagibacter sp. HIMB1509 TaxID=3413339 RepID=UPI003F859855
MREIIKKIKNRKLVIGVIGLGYVGLPLSILFAKKKFKIIGFDIDKKKIKSLCNQRSYIERISKSDIKILSKSSSFTSNFGLISKCDVIIITVPTPLTKNQLPDLHYVKSCLKQIFPFIKKNQTIILESTSYPGTTRELIGNKLKSKFHIGKELFVGFSSERIDPGLNEDKIHLVPKVVSGYSDKCLKIVSEIYRSIFNSVVKSESLEVAEFSKLLENVYRSVNIGFINEMKMIADKMQLDIFEIIKVSSTKPFGFRTFHPGPGIGGHCIPIDPMYLYWKSKQLNYNAEFIKLSKETNFKVLNFVVKKINKLQKKIKIPSKKIKILILGMSYKKNLDDIRESSSIKLIKKLLNLNFRYVDYSDPHISKTNINSINYKKKSINLTIKNLKKYHITLLMTDHDKFNYKKIYQYSNTIIDCRGKFKVGDKVIRA